jgi:hypothetical protein
MLSKLKHLTRQSCGTPCAVTLFAKTRKQAAIPLRRANCGVNFQTWSRVSTFKIKLGTPHHGWLPVDIEAAGEMLVIDASDVPIDPLDQLLESVLLSKQGKESEVWWHLEPAGYYFAIKPQTDKVKIEISFAESDMAKRKLVCKFEISANNYLVQVYQVLSSFYAKGFEDPHWPELREPSRLEKLGELL